LQVEGEAQGDEDKLGIFLNHVDDGPRHAKVVQLTQEDRQVVEGEASFSIRH
jgi:acylphosphatase